MFGKRWGGLRLRILGWSTVPTMIILGAVAVVMFYAYQDMTANLVVGRDREVTRLAAEQISAEMDEYADLLDAAARMPALAGGEPSTQRAGLRQASSRLAVLDGGTVLLDSFGRVIASEPERPEITGEDWTDRPYYQEVLRSEPATSPVFSDLVGDGPGGTQVIAIAVPIRGPEGGVVGVIVGMFRVGGEVSNAFYEDLLKLRLAEAGTAILVDGQGRVLYHTEPRYIGGDASALPDVRQAMSGGVGAMRSRDAQGRDILSSFAPVPGTPWGFIDQELWGTLIKSSQGYRRVLLLLLVLGVAAPALVVMVGAQRITRPLRELIGAAQRVAGGDFGQAISARTGDEVEELAEQFNIMSARLQESYAQLADRADARTKELAALNEIAAVVSQSLDLTDILSAALKRTLEVLAVQSGGIYLLEEETGLLTVAAARGFAPQFVNEIDRLRMGEGFSGRVAQTGEPLVVRDVSADPRLTRLAVREEKFHSLAVVPMSCKGKTLGTLFALTRGYREFSHQEVQLLISIGHQIGIAVENARLFGQSARRMTELERLYHAERRRAEQFRVIGEVGRRITSILAEEELLGQVARLIQEAFDYYHVGIGLIEGDEVVYRIGAGALWDDPAFRFKPERLKVGQEGISGWVAAMGQPLLVPDVMRDPHYVWMRGSKTRSELTVPLTVKGQVFGVLDVQSDELDAFDATDMAVVQSLAHQAAVAIENARLYERARQAAAMEERNRLARDLHDAVTQSLFSASLIAETLPEVWAKDPAAGGDLLRELRLLSRGALAEMRTLLLELRPSTLTETSLVDLLHQLGEAVSGRTGLPVSITASQHGALPTDVHVALYRIAQEALNNVVKHAQARQVTIRLHTAAAAGGEERQQVGQVELSIADDGRGFDPRRVAPDCLGLGILRERAEAIGAALDIDSQPGAGTRITAVWTAGHPEGGTP